VKLTTWYNGAMKALWDLVRRFWLPITIFVVIILGLAILIQIYKETNCFAGWVFNFLQQWAIVLGAAVTFLLALAAFWSISDTRHFQYVESITKSLDEVRSWAMDTKRALYLPRWGHQEASQYDLRDNLEHMATRSVFVKSDAERLVKALQKGEANIVVCELASKVNDATTRLDQFIKDLRQTDPGDFEGLRTQWGELNTHFNALVEVASRVRIPVG